MKFRSLVSEAEFLALPESPDKIELLDGEVVVTPSPSLRHQRLLRLIATSLTQWSESFSEPHFIGMAPCDVRFGPGRILQPDLFLIRQAIDEDAPMPLDVVPDLCLEILSSNRAHDRVTKRLLYGAAGVKEYWVIDPNGSVERFSEPGLSAVDRELKALESPLLPGFSLRFAALDPRFD